ncbi:MAG: DUF1707 SHOCT-like domain-containing protein [Actinocrinis sp.]
MTTGDAPNAPAQRIGFQEREAAVERLRLAAGEGQITLDELETRMEAALAARTADDVAVLLADLPVPAGAAALALTGEAAEPVRLAVSHGTVNRMGAWRVPELVTLEMRHSTATLDLRNPALPARGVRIEISARHSSIKILVRQDTAVDMDNLGRHHASADDRHAARVPAYSGAPIVLVGDLHHSTVKILRPSNSMLLPLRRRRLFRRRRRELTG